MINIDEIDFEKLESAAFKLEAWSGMKVRMRSKERMLAAFRHAFFSLDEKKQEAFVAETDLPFETKKREEKEDDAITIVIVRSHALYPIVMYGDIVFQPKKSITNKVPIEYINKKAARFLINQGQRILYNELFTHMTPEEVHNYIS